MVGEVKWSEVKWSEVKRNEMEWSGVEWSKLGRTVKGIYGWWSEVKWSEVKVLLKWVTILETRYSTFSP